MTKLSNEKVEEFTAACLSNKKVLKTLYEPFKLAVKDLFGAFFRFSVLFTTFQNISELNKPELKDEIKKITPKITKIRELFDLILDEIENFSYYFKDISKNSFL